MSRLEILILFLLLFSCKPIPSIDEAKSYYLRNFPNHKILKIEIDEDEAACMTFHLKVQNESNEIQYKYLFYFYEEYDGKKWVLSENSE